MSRSDVAWALKVGALIGLLYGLVLVSGWAR